MREGFDIGLEMSGHPTALPEMIDNMNHGGRIAMLGLPSQSIDIDWGKVVTHMLTLKGIYGREMFETWYAMSAMLSSNPVLHRSISAVVTDKLPATEWEKGFEIARNGVGGIACPSTVWTQAPRVMLETNQTPRAVNRSAGRRAR